MRKIFFEIFRYGVVIAILVFAGYYLWQNYDEYVTKVHFTWKNISLLIGLNLLTLVTESARLRLQIRKLDADLGQVRSFLLMGLLQLVNQLIPKGGTLSTGYYLHKKYGVSLSKYYTMITSYIVIMTFGASIFGLTVITYYALFLNRIYWILIVIYIGLIGAAAAIIGASHITIPKDKLPRIIETILEAFKHFYSDIKLMSALLGIEIVYSLLSAFRFLIAFEMLSTSITFLQSTVFITVGNFFKVASFTPAGLGISELGVAWTSGAFGLQVMESGIAAGLDRLAYIVVITAAGSIGFFFLSNRSEFHRPKKNAEELSDEDSKTFDDN